MQEPNQKKFGLALSGGGFRATLFHLGAIRFLYEAGFLKDVKRICAVSGGSIVAAHVVLNWDKYASAPSPDEDLFDKAAKELLDFVQTGIRGQIIRRYILSWVLLLPRLFPASIRWTFPNLLRRHYDALLKKATLKDLRVPGIPDVFLNCTSLTTGCPCYFGPQGFYWFDGDDRKHVATEETRVSFAVAASSAFPPLFPPVKVSHDVLVCSPGEFPNSHYLTDGGVYDNLGVNELFWKGSDSNIDVLAVLDAEGRFDPEYDEQYTWLVGRNVRASDLMMARVSALHLRGLDIDRTLLIQIKDTYPGHREHVLTVNKQRTLSKVRTDLDEFSELEITALIAHGFCVTRNRFLQQNFISGEVPEFTWDPLKNLAYLNQNEEKALKKLKRSSQRKWRLFAFNDWASILTAIFLMAITTLTYVLGSAGLQHLEDRIQDAEAAGARTAAVPLDKRLDELAATIERLRARTEPQPKPAPTNNTTFLICRGEHRDRCPTDTDWIGCNDPQPFINARCKTANNTLISTRGGNRCGYSVYQVLCTN